MSTTWADERFSEGEEAVAHGFDAVEFGGGTATVFAVPFEFVGPLEEVVPGSGEGFGIVGRDESACLADGEDFGKGGGVWLDDGDAGGEGFDEIEAKCFGVGGGDAEEGEVGEDGILFLERDVGRPGDVVGELGGGELLLEFGDEFLVTGGHGTGDVQAGVGVFEIVAEMNEGFDEMMDAFFPDHAGEVADGWQLRGSSE